MRSSRRLESALAAIESLPALPVAAVRLAAAEPHAPEAQAMAREASSSVMGRRSGVRTFASARNAVLSICVLRAVHENRQADLWRQALRTAVAARTLSPDDPETAFLAGLMTEVGASALDIVAPRTCARIERLSEQLGAEPDALERRLLSMDRHAAGRRLADRWRLPMAVREALRLRGAAADAVAHHPAASLLGAVALAEDWSRDGSIDETRITCLGMAPSRVRAAVESIEQRLAGLWAVYGWAATPNPDLQRAALAWARQLLARWDAAAPGEPVDAGVAPADGCAAMADVLRAGAADGVVGILCQDEAAHPWLAHWGAGPGAWRWLEPPTPGRDLLRVASAEPFGAPLVEAAPWLADHLPSGWRARDLTVRALPGPRAVLLLRADARVESHLKTWAGRLVDARDRDQARRIEGAWRAASQSTSEDAAASHLTEMAAGAAHEMNNPLMVISGRAQLLAQRLPSDSDDGRDAHRIHENARRLSEMIRDLHELGAPVRCETRSVGAEELVRRAVEQWRGTFPDTPLMIDGLSAVSSMQTDPDLAAAALCELLRNAAAAVQRPTGMLRLSASVDPLNDRCLLRVVDDGPGMSRHVLRHAFDPFFSAQAAGRRPGLGLCRARRWARALGGDLTLRSRPGAGTQAVLALPIEGPKPQGASHATTREPASA